jgi:phosphohistidine phosphatase
LTPKGINRMHKAARGLRRLDIPFDAILTSPLVRARDTAEIVAQTLDLEAHLEEIAGLAPESSVNQLISGLTRFQNHEHLLLVGHQPLLGEAAAFLLKTNSPLALVLKKGGICRIEVDNLPPAKPGMLHWLLAPKQLRLIGAVKFER